MLGVILIRHASVTEDVKISLVGAVKNADAARIARAGGAELQIPV